MRLHFRRQHGGHAFAFHRGWFLDFATVRQLLQHRNDNALSLVNVLQLPAAEQHIEQHFVFVLEELAGLVDFGIDVVVARLGADADFLQLLLMDLGALFLLAGLLVAKLPVVQDLANGRPFEGGHFNQVEAGRASQFQSLDCGDDAELFAGGADEANRTDADLFVDPLMVPVVLRVTVVDTPVLLFPLERK